MISGWRFLKKFMSLCQGLIYRPTLMSSPDSTTLYSLFAEKTVKGAFVIGKAFVSSYKAKSWRWNLSIVWKDSGLLNQWCNFVEVLAFSRCVQGNLEGYDPEGARPGLIDEFVEHQY
ncbi:DCN1-like protein, partial [Tanacetum coccineum]